MRCPRCGTWLRAGVSRCGPCGADLDRPSKDPANLLDDAGDDAAPPWVSGWIDRAKRRRRARIHGVLVVVVAVGLVGLGAAGATWLDDGGGQRVQSAERRPASSDLARAGDFSEVYEAVNSGVGQVLVDTCTEGDYTGTGFLIQPRLMATAQHVVAEAWRVRVDLDGEVLSAAIHGVDRANDLAVLRLERPADGHVFRFADSDAPPGTRVAAIGYPLEEPKTLTEGTISGLDREIDTDAGSFAGLIQTDTAINPGNSGGPLVDLGGEVVGVADAIRRNAQGIGFAVPASTAGDLLTEPLDSQALVTCS